MGQVDHRRVVGECPGDFGANPFLPSTLVRMGIGAVVRAGDGGGATGIWDLLRVEVRLRAMGYGLRATRTAVGLGTIFRSPKILAVEAGN